MDDLTLLAIGRQFVEFAIQREQLWRELQAAKAELAKPKDPPA